MPKKSSLSRGQILILIAVAGFLAFNAGIWASQHFDRRDPRYQLTYSDTTYPSEQAAKDAGCAHPVAVARPAADATEVSRCPR